MVQSIDIYDIFIKIFFRTTMLRYLKLNMCHCLLVFYQIVQMVALGYKIAPPSRVKNSNNRNRWKYLKVFFFRTSDVALPSGPLPRLFKPRSEGPKWPYARGSLVWSIEIHRQYEKYLLSFRCLKFDIEDCIVELFWVCSVGGLRYQKALLHWVLFFVHL